MLKQIYCIFLFTIISISVHSQEKIEVKFSGSSVSRPGKHEIETNRIGLYSPKGVKGQVFIPSGIDGTSPAALIVYFHGNSGGKLNAYQSEAGPVQKLCEEKKCLVLSIQNLWGIDTNTRDTTTSIRDTLDATEDMVVFLIKNKIADSDRIFATGASAGGFVAWSAAIYIPDLVRAIGNFKGNYYQDVADQMESQYTQRREFLKLGDSRTVKEVSAYFCIGGKSEAKRVLEQLPLAKKSLEDKGSPVFFEEFPKEGHGLSSGCINGFWKMVTGLK